MRYLYISLLLTLLAGCATHAGQRDASGNPALHRLSDDALATRTSQAPAKLGVAEVAALAHAGRSPDEIVARMRATGSRLSMDPEQQRALRERGVKAPVIEALVTAEVEARRTDRITAEVDRAVARQRQEAARREIYRYYSYDPYWGWPYSAMGYGWYGGHHGWHSGIGFSWGW